MQKQDQNFDLHVILRQVYFKELRFGKKKIPTRRKGLCERNESDGIRIEWKENFAIWGLSIKIAGFNIICSPNNM
jgi:hypothetical protein